MSIILDALKKSQDDTKKDSPVDALQVKREARSSSNKRQFIFLLLAASLALMLYGIMQFFGRSSSKDMPTAQVLKADVMPLPSRQEIIYEPKSEDAEAIPRREYPEFILNGIMYLKDAPQAIVNGSVVEEGEMIGGAKVVKITKDNVVLNFEGAEILLNLK